MKSKIVGAGAGTAVGRRERKSFETREKIFRTALRLFADRGFFETTTEQITEAADVGQGTFFNYFPTKQHILTVLFEIQLRKVSAACVQADSEGAVIKDILHSLVHDIAKEPGKSQALTRSLFSAFVSNEVVRGLVSRTLLEGRKELAVMIATGQRRGEIRTDRNAADLALAYQKGISGTLLLWAVQSKGSLKSWLEKAFQDFWAGAGATRGSLR